MSPVLGRYFDGGDLGCGLFKMKSQNPHAGDGLTIHLRRLEPPVLRGLQGNLGKILAWSRRVERRVRNIAACIDRGPYRHVDLAANGLTRTWENVGQNSLSDRALHRPAAGSLSLRNWRLRRGRGYRGRWSLLSGWRRWLSLVRSQLHSCDHRDQNERRGDERRPAAFGGCRLTRLAGRGLAGRLRD